MKSWTAHPKTGPDFAWAPSKNPIKMFPAGASLAVQRLRLRAANARGAGSIPHAAWSSQKKSSLLPEAITEGRLKFTNAP